MRPLGTVLISVFVASVAASAQDLSIRAWQMESKGDPTAARDLLIQAAQRGDPDASQAYAEYLDRHRDPGAREAYEKLLTGGRAEQRQMAARRLLLLDLIAGDRAPAERHLEQYRRADGKDFTLPQLSPVIAEKKPVASIPGPLHSFARMAALSPDTNPDELLTSLARNVVTNGYQAMSTNEALEPTEYLKLIIRYLSQARELEKLADADGSIKIATCDSPQAADLLRVLGYRMRGGCGEEVVLATVNATRAFLTLDPALPAAALQDSLPTIRQRTYSYKPTQVTVLYGADYWLAGKDKPGDFIDAFLGDPALCRLYLGLS